MIQFLRFNSDLAEDSTFSIVEGKNSIKFFSLRIFYLILFIYSTLFLAVAIPFVKTPFIPIYFIGSAATVIYIIRFINHILKYFQNSQGAIRIFDAGIEIKNKNNKLNIPYNEITYIERNFLGNLVIKRESGNISFPLVLLSDDDREKLLSFFEDMSPKRTQILKKIWDIVDAIVVALVLAVHIIQYIVQAYYIPTSSMEDTLKVGDNLFVEKITYGPIVPKMIWMDKHIHLSFMGIRTVKNGDIVIFRPPHEEDKDYIKRCIAIPGDKFEIKNGHVFINDKRIDEPYAKGLTEYFSFGGEKDNELQGVVPKGKIIVLGDNRENSQDSRYFGYLDINRIKGRAFILYWNRKRIMNSDFSNFGLIR